MKKIIICLALICSCGLSSFAQNETDDADIVFTKVEKDAQFPGGLADWKQHLINYLNADIPVVNGAPPGSYTVIIKFIVSKDGSISKMEAETNNGFGMEKEVMRVILLSKSWTPAMQNGRTVNAYRRQPVTFVVQGKKNKRRD